MKKADKSGAAFALLLGEDEVADQAVTLKALRDDQAQQRLPQTALAHTLSEQLTHTP
jgi:histidyl-tRNA synthetase